MRSAANGIAIEPDSLRLAKREHAPLTLCELSGAQVSFMTAFGSF